MASFSAPPAFVTRPLTRISPFSSSSPSPPPRGHPFPFAGRNPGLLLSISSPEQPATLSKVQQQRPATSTAKADSTDWIASTLTRRSGLEAGLAWAAFLAAGVILEQFNTRFEVSQQETNTRDVEKQEEVVLSNGIRYYDLKVGGGASPRPGDLVVIDLEGKVKGDDTMFVDTFGSEKKSVALVVGSRPYSKGMCEGIEYALRSMRVGGRRRVIVPSSFAFGETGADLGSGVPIPPFANLEYVVEVESVSVATA